MAEPIGQRLSTDDLKVWLALRIIRKGRLSELVDLAGVSFPRVKSYVRALEIHGYVELNKASGKFSLIKDFGPRLVRPNSFVVIDDNLPDAPKNSSQRMWDVILASPKPMTVRYVCEHSGVHEGTAWKYLDSLADHGLMHKWREGCGGRGSRLVYELIRPVPGPDAPILSARRAWVDPNVLRETMEKKFLRTQKEA